MRTVLVTLSIAGFIVLEAARASAQIPAIPGCTASSFVVKVVSETTVMVGCGRVWPGGQWRLDLWEYDEDWELDPAARVRLRDTAEVTDPSRIATVAFKANSLRDSRNYRLVIRRVTPASDPVIASFSTAPEASLTIFADRKRIEVRSAVALNQQPACTKCALIEQLTPKLVRQNQKPVPPEEVSHPVAVAVSKNTDDTVARATLTMTGGGLSDGAAKLRFEGLTNVFGTAVVAAGEIENTVPSTIDDAEYAVQLGFQAARGEPDAYSIDGSAHPTIASWGLTAWRALGEVDLGHNDRQSANSIIVGSELLLPFRVVDAGPVFGVKPVARLTYETDRHGDTGNVVGVAEALVRLRNLYQPRKVVRQIAAALMSEEQGRTIAPSKVKTPDFGFVIPVQVGFDFGKSIRQPESAAGANGAGATDPTISRLRIGTAAVIEYKRLTISDTVTARYLFADERSDAAAEKLEGLKGYNELGFKISLDRLGHYGFGLTYKYGAAPPKFETVHSVASTMVVIF